MEIRKPSAGWYGIAVLMLLVFGIVAPVSLLITLIWTSLGGHGFSAPGSTTFKAEKPATYVVWCAVDAPAEGIGVRVREGAGGPHLPFMADTSRQESIGGSERRSVGTFQADRAGDYSVEVADRWARGTFYVQADHELRNTLSALGIYAGLALGWIGAPLLAIATFIRRFVAKRRIKRAARAS